MRPGCLEWLLSYHHPLLPTIARSAVTIAQSILDPVTTITIATVVTVTVVVVTTVTTS
jgi:hypothetical protein